MRWPPRSRPKASSSPRSRRPSGQASGSASSAGRRASRSSYWNVTRNSREGAYSAKVETGFAIGIRADNTRLRHAARHEATDGQPEITAQRPHHGSADAVRFGDHGFVGHIDPFAVEPHAIVAAGGLPIHVADGGAVGVGATGSLAALQSFKPRL